MKPVSSYLKTLFVDYFSLNGYLVPQAEAETEIREGVSFRGTNILILIIAILIASLGLNTNSTAVIIGAMLISPLMGPIIGLGLGVGIQDFDLLKRSFRNLAMAAGFSVLASTVYFLISPVSEGHSELLARTSPTIYDVLIGFFGGGAGIVAIGSRSKGNVIPGVAIATALMPPLCTAGYGIATWQLTYFIGAFYLFLINSIFICLATFIGVKLMKYKPVEITDPVRAKKVRRIVYTIAILTLLPSIYLTWNMMRQAQFSMNATRFVNREFRFPDTHVISTKADYNNGHKEIDVTLLGKALPADSLRLAMSAKLQYYGLQGTRLNIVQGDNAATASQLQGSSVRDIYELAQASIASHQVTIDSLRAVISLASQSDSISAVIGPEIKVLFPQIEDIAVSRAIFNNVAVSRLDTANVALVRYSAKLPPAKLTELKKYLQARLRMKSISIVDVGNAVETLDPGPGAPAARKNSSLRK